MGVAEGEVVVVVFVVVVEELLVVVVEDDDRDVPGLHCDPVFHREKQNISLPDSRSAAWSGHRRTVRIAVRAVIA